MTKPKINLLRNRVYDLDPRFFDRDLCTRSALTEHELKVTTSVQASTHLCGLGGVALVIEKLWPYTRCE